MLALSSNQSRTAATQKRGRLSVLLDLARVEKHPLPAEAKQLLGVYLGKDHGTDWTKWEEPVGAWLKQNAD